MSYLSEHWRDGLDTSLTGEALQTSLLAQLLDDPDLFKNFVARDIADILTRLNFIKPDENLLIPLYAAYDIRKNHAFRAWDFGRRMELMDAIENDDILPILETRLEKLHRYNDLHSRVFGFQSDSIETVEKAPRYFKKDCGTLIPPEEIDNYTLDQRVEILSSGAHDRAERKIFLNTYKPTQPGKLLPSYHKGDVQAAAMVLHEGRHTFMDCMGCNADALTDQEFKDVATILYINSCGAYYLTGSNDRNYLNPCEKDAYDFQADMENFLNAAPDMRRSLIRQIGMRRDYHASFGQNRISVATPAPAVIAA